jgi:hypothetical protein
METETNEMVEEIVNVECREEGLSEIQNMKREASSFTFPNNPSQLLHISKQPKPVPSHFQTT